MKLCATEEGLAMASSLSFLPHSLPHYLPCTRSSSSDGPIRRPSAPVKEATPPIPRPPLEPSPPPPSRSPIFPSSLPSVTIEYQRQRAKELQEYFLDRKYEKEASQGRLFGWSIKNEVTNGRWAMFGIAVGLLTEYATGSDFVDQMKIIISNLGIADLE